MFHGWKVYCNPTSIVDQIEHCTSESPHEEGSVEFETWEEKARRAGVLLATCYTGYGAACQFLALVHATLQGRQGEIRRERRRRRAGRPGSDWADNEGECSQEKQEKGKEKG